MSYYPPFTKCQDLGLELLNKKPGIPLAFGNKARTAVVEVFKRKEGMKTRIWLGRQIVYDGLLDSEYDFNTIWEEMVEPFISSI